jgi:nucleotide-binding universal stress UspA family protein
MSDSGAPSPRDQSAHVKSAQEETGHDETADHRSAYEQSAYEQSAYEQSAYEQSAGDVPAKQIVVGVGGSPAAATALRWAAEQSRVTGVPLRIVHAWQITASPVGATRTAFWVASAADARARTTHWVLDTLGADAATLRWVLDIVEGPPGPILVERSRGAALLVLGTGEHVGLRRLVAGSVSHYALSHSSAPVVAVRALEPAESAVLELSSQPGGSA